jgi:hypothetical protein
MRKLISALLVCLLAVCVAAPVYADGEAAAIDIDLEAMSLEELLELHEAVEAAIIAKNGSVPSIICDGLYVAGTSIKPGMYMLTCTEAGQQETLYINTFETLDDYNTYDESRSSNASYRLAQSTLRVGDSAMVRLDEGMVMEILYGTCSISPVMADWVP